MSTVSVSIRSDVGPRSRAHASIKAVRRNEGISLIDSGDKCVDKDFKFVFGSSCPFSRCYCVIALLDAVETHEHKWCWKLEKKYQNRRQRVEDHWKIKHDVEQFHVNVQQVRQYITRPSLTGAMGEQTTLCLCGYRWAITCMVHHWCNKLNKFLNPGRHRYAGWSIGSSLRFYQIFHGYEAYEECQLWSHR